MLPRALTRVNCNKLLRKTQAFLPLNRMHFYLLLLRVSPYTEVALSVRNVRIAILVPVRLPEQNEFISRVIG